ncbi:hypothetical protein ACYOEI_31655, partial [Singulisphaera rosea]
MRHPHGLYGCLTIVLVLIASHQATAGVTTYTGGDAGVGPADSHPNTDAAAASFASTASQFGVSNAITFESLPLGTPQGGASLTVAPGVGLTLNNTDQTVVAGYPFGISNASPNPITGGYNTTPGGSQFVEFVPSLSGGTASLVFSFDSPIQGFGVNLTGLGNIPGDIHLVFDDDGTPHDIPITGDVTGGILFIGFTDPGASITKITIEERNVLPNRRDAFGVDDVQYVRAVPEPASATLLAVGLFGLAALTR